ncbi:GDT1-like protein 2 [Morus notabilis]|uniref:GDT1 family protein n=1 Tax=Morus notabilis TaxID=981085 RepID=W9RGN9_9ROSA|nr:GDT1-like protein 2 [Morus notabilis]
MQKLVVHNNKPIIISSRRKLPLLAVVDSLPCCATLSRNTICSSSSLRCRDISRSYCGTVRVQASNVSIGSGGYDGREENEGKKIFTAGSPKDSSPDSQKPLIQIPYPLAIALVLFGCASVFSLIAFAKGPSTLLEAFAKSGFTAAFSLIFVSEIGDKTFFIAALLAMQYKKGLNVAGLRRLLGEQMRLLSAAAAVNLPAEGSRSGAARVREEEAGLGQGLTRDVAGLREEDGRDLGELAEPSREGERGKRRGVDDWEFLDGEEIVRARV